MNKHTPGQRPIPVDFIARLLLASALLCVAWLAATPFIPPAVIPASAAPDSFSAERAMQDLQIVAREPHGAGSAAQFRLRDYILAQAAALGLKGEVQASISIENVIVRVPGTASTRAVLVTGHYDSHPPAPGAGDNGISVAAMLETMRALRAASPMRNDVVFLFTDGEELGWVGAGAFVRLNPAARDQTGVVLCFDARPGNGPLNLSSTSPGDAWLIRQLAAANPPLHAFSWRNVEERSDSDTDCTSVFAARGFITLEFENEPRGSRYHMPTDTPEAVSPRLVQALGDSMIQLARHFGNLDLTEARLTVDETFFTVPFIGVLIYPPWLTPAAAIAGMLALALLIAVAWWQRRLSLSRTALGLLLFLAALILIILLASWAWDRILEAHTVTYDLDTDDPYFQGLSSWMAGLLGIVFVLCIATLYALSRRIDTLSLAVSGVLSFLFVWWVAYFFLDSENPLTNPPLAWSVLAAAASLACVMFVRSPPFLAVLLLLAALPLFVLGVPELLPQAIQPGEEGPYALLLALGLVLGLLTPQITFILGTMTERKAATHYPSAAPVD